MFAWNGLQSALFEVFAALTDEDRRRIKASRLWHKLGNDKARRNAVLTQAEVKLTSQPRLLANVRWVHGNAERLSPRRNVAAHTPMWMAVVGVSNSVFPDLIAARGKDVKTLLENPLANTWKAMRGDLYALSHFTRLIAIQLTDPHAMPAKFPARPRLQFKLPRPGT